MLGALLGGYLNKVGAVLRQDLVSATAKQSSSDSAARSARSVASGMHASQLP
jgi:hypothetical protein